MLWEREPCFPLQKNENRIRRVRIVSGGSFDLIHLAVGLRAPDRQHLSSMLRQRDRDAESLGK